MMADTFPGCITAQFFSLPWFSEQTLGLIHKQMQDTVVLRTAVRGLDRSGKFEGALQIPLVLKKSIVIREQIRRRRQSSDERPESHMPLLQLQRSQFLSI